MEPENKFATAEEKDEEEEKEGGVDRSFQYQVVSKQRERDLKGAGPIFKKWLHPAFSFRLFLPFLRLPSLCFKSVLGLSSESV